MIKREFINRWVKPKSVVLDVGCGQGGDLSKWKSLDVHLIGVDPNPIAIQEARRRSNGFGVFVVGCITDIPDNMRFDVICYNFSFQYEDPKNYKRLVSMLNVGGILMGIVPDSGTDLQDPLISIQRVDDTHISVWIPDTPYYLNGPVVEPLVTIGSIDGVDLILDGEQFSIYKKFVYLKR